MNKVFVFDIDGTLITSDHRVLPTTRKALSELQNRGHRLILASARPPRSIRNIIEDLPIKRESFVSMNGALVVRDGEDLFHAPIESNQTRRIVEQSRQVGLHVNLYTETEWFVETESPLIDREAEIVGFPPTSCSDLLELTGHLAHKLLIMGDESGVRSFQDWVRSQELDVEATLSKPTYCEVVAEGVSKRDALKRLLDALVDPYQQLIAFGDGENDIGMLEMADHSVAMGGSPPAVRRAADVVTKSNDDDGILHALRSGGYL